MAYIYTTHLPGTHHKQNENINKEEVAYVQKKIKKRKILELKNTVTDLKTEKGSTAHYQAENRISELEERSFKTIKSEEQKGKTEFKKI